MNSSDSDDPYMRFLKDFARAPEQGFDPIAAQHPAPPPLEEGQRWGQGRYRLVKRLGSGVSAEVWEARETDGAQRPIALKIQHPRRSALLTDNAERFKREGYALARLDHPNIVRLLDTGRDHGRRYLALELLQGAPLTPLRQPLQRILAWFMQALSALGHLHARGLVHRDLKPRNLLVIASTQQVKLIDFGLTRPNRAILDADALEHSLTHSNLHIGTPLYMSPEQARGTSKAVGPASDLYALGVMLYEALCGRPPFLPPNDASDPREALIRMHRHTPVPTPRFAYDLPSPARAQLTALLSDLLAKPYHARPESAADVQKRLTAALDLLPSSARPPTPTPHRSPTPPPEGREPDGRLLMRYALHAERTQRPQLIALTGASEADRHALARWLTETLYEAGRARILRVNLARHASLPEATHDAAYQHLRRPPLTPDQLASLLHAPQDHLAVRFMSGEDTSPRAWSALLHSLTQQPAQRLIVFWMSGDHDAIPHDALTRWMAPLLDRTDTPVIALWTRAEALPTPPAHPNIVQHHLAPTA